MKEQAIRKINKIGKVSNIITLIAKILVGIAMTVTLIATIVCFIIPESMLKFDIKSSMTMEMNYSELGVSMSEEDIAVAEAELKRTVLVEGDADFTDVVVEGDKITMTGDLETFSFTMRDATWLALMGSLVLVLTFVTLFFISALCKAFRDCQSPFEENVIRKMQNFAIALIPWAIVSTVVNSITNSLLNNKLSIIFSVDLGVVLIVLVVLVLVYIFKYGAVLQQESDETL
ncbi:MAG: DUF2975 domain-containing protein [Lachnospiraceae bacterium]|nr:DUF2975 domain-containing protein [Lachnospiraceae bacterium]